MISYLFRHAFRHATFPKGEGFYPSLNKYFTKFFHFPLAIFPTLGYDMLALKKKEC